MNFHCIFVLVNAFLFSAPICRRKNGTESSPIIRWLFGTSFSALVSRLLLGDFLAPITRLKRAYCTPKNTPFRRRKDAELVPILRRQLNLGADLVPIRCLFLGAPETRRKIGAYCDLRSVWVVLMWPCISRSLTLVILLWSNS